MRCFAGSVAGFLFFCSVGHAQNSNFVAECWVRCDAVQAKSRGGDLNAFRKYCDHVFDGRIYQDDHGELVCAAEVSRIAADSIPGYSESCPTVTPVEIKRWLARCGEVARAIRYGWRVGDCVTRRNIGPNNIRCQ